VASSSNPCRWGGNVVMLFNTHWHWDHTGSNELLAKQGTRIFAHEYTKQWLERT
jgi:glyoxylase-like metal-dependent hydrolase (beta-lactamase superfamily II)